MRIKYSKELLEIIVKSSLSVAEVIRKLGLKQSGGNHSHISRRLKEYGIDTAHFLGGIARMASRARPTKLTPSQVLVDNRLGGRREGASKLRRALLESGVAHKCAVCELPPFGTANTYNYKLIISMA